ncbi:hypothetical protein ASD79_16005 [Caulobacter sp. Root655]|uniref:hypothetical protein n=1 Tax=Caulobacter sp. Root655 TaxID=1736578 RepID=UPI0006FABDE3|nr:hypothetical protein [Caulobacter sp. Root655]KRA57816.1 hypothetical protein ASD79_16005 [Caulobacter sp. Root655]
MRPTQFPPFRVVAFDDSRAGRRNRRLAAFGGAVALHIALLCAFLGSPPGGVLAAGGQAGAEAVEPYIVLSLSGLRRPEATDTSTTQASQDAAILAAMMARMRQAQPEVVIASATTPQKPSLGALFDAVRRDRAARDAAASGKSDRDDGGRGADARAPDAKPLDKAGPRSSANSDVKASAGSGSLWGFLEPCWRKLPGRSTVPVTLEVVLDARGMIATPPKIVRPSGAAPDEARLVAEARALAALGGCLPYRGPDGANGAPITVGFAASR